MKEVVKDLDVGDFFRYIGPGGIVILSLVVWKPVMESGLGVWWDTIVSRDVLLYFGGIVGAYTVGLVLEVVSTESYRKLHDHRPGAWYRRVGRWALGTPNRRISSGIVERRTRVAEELEEVWGGSQGASLSNVAPFDVLRVYRVARGDAPGTGAYEMVRHIEGVHRQFRFSIGAARAFALVWLHSWAYVLVKTDYSGSWDDIVGSLECIWGIIILGLAARALADLLRKVVWEKWVQEHELTGCLTGVERGVISA